ncbi:class I SAM-dependent methyltransferase [Streptomyces filamentosus]|uniref:class I SAM-dependent methyltransferase n=1 Tax=Streptomyces filamentosus TaxID=67294 RepID=UPI0033E1C9BA
MRAPRRNADADWDAWPVQDYLAENYRRLHPCDVAVIRHHAAVYRLLGPGSVERSVEFGAGPNLYPLMPAATACRRVDALEPGAAGHAYLRAQLRNGPDPSWQPFYALCRRLDPALPRTLAAALRGVRAVRGDARAVRRGAYGLGSMSFVAESVTEDREEFARVCREFIGCVRPGGHLLAAFMENMPSYRIGDGPVWPGCPVDAAAVRAAFAPYTRELAVRRVAKDRTLPDYGDTGILLLHAVRADLRPRTPVRMSSSTKAVLTTAT